MKTPLYSRYSYCLLLSLQAIANGAEIQKIANTVALNTGGSWTGGLVPGVNDVMLWDTGDTYSAAASLPQIGGDMSVSGIKITTNTGARNQTLRFIGFQNTSSANTLTIGAGGIDMSAAQQSWLGQSKIILGANQSWNVSDANTAVNPMTFNNNEDLAFQATAAGVPFNLNNKVLSTTGNGQITIGAGWTISSGTINCGNNLLVLQGGGSQTMNVQNTVTLNVNSGRLRIGSQSAPTGQPSINCAAPIFVNNTGTLEFRSNNSPALNQTGAITLNPGSIMAYLVDNTAPITVSGGINAVGSTSLRMTGGGNPGTLPVFSGALTGSAAISYQNTATAAGGVLRLTGNNSAYAGTITLNGATGNRALRFGSTNAGSTSATWEVGTGNILQSEGLAVSLGTLNGAGTVTNTHASNVATYSIGAGNFSGIIANNLTTPTVATAVTKTGPGTLVLTGFNTYTGATTVNQGTLVDTSNHVSPDPQNIPPTSVTVADGATFGTLVKASDTTLSVNNLGVGATTGGTLQFDFGSFGNPAIASLAASNLFFHGPSTIKVVGKNLTTGTFPLLQYTAKDPGSTAVGGLGLVLPTRTSATLSDNGNTVSVNISATQQVKWAGNVSDDWDIDPDGSGAVGTPNWLTTVSNTATRYIQGSIGADAVNFTDSAAGGNEKTVNLTTTVSPSGLVFDNSAKNYTITGANKISGPATLEKKGSGVVTIANTIANDFTGGATISAGSLRIGDGVTPGAGQIAGAIQNEGTLVLNRPDNVDFTNSIAGGGTLEKAGPGTTSFAQAANITGPVTLTAGKLKFSAGGNLSGVVSGPGELECGGGILELGGTASTPDASTIPNTNTGLITVSGGTLRLNKAVDVDAFAGNVDITGTGIVATINANQFPNTATVRALGTSADSLSGVVGTETYANVVVNGTAATQLILRYNAVVTGTGTVTTGILGVASAHTATVNTLVMTSPAAIFRIAANTGASTYNVGSGGITASGGEVQVKFNTTDQDGFLNLAGDLTTTGNLSFTNGGYAGGNQNVVNLTGDRIFNIGASTTTTFAPDLSSAAGNLTKSGGGTLVLNNSCAANITNGTTVSAGTLVVDGTLAGAVTVGSAGTLGGLGGLSGATVVNGTVTPGSVAPGVTIGTLGMGAATFGPDSDLLIGIGSWTGTTAGTDWDQVSAASLAFTATPSNPLVIHVSGTPTGFTEVSKTMVIGTSTAAPTGFDAAAVSVVKEGFAGTGTFAVQLNGNNVELVYTAAAGNAYDTWASGAGLTPANNGQAQDPENDGNLNREEFALNGDPLSGKADGKVVSKLASVGGQNALTLTLPVRNGVIFSGATEQSGAADGILYRVQASDELGSWTLAVAEVTGADATAIQAGLPALSPGWSYRSFRSPGPVAGDPQEYIRVLIDPAG
ncbi:autotransporter-associated beta strand repeat-containing protein [Haloferula sp. BvORR071]|uniref:beta strand repeat-containing protein n=1 Tax=Haloferula sp. BvORR071 TaxID=1396141 RepID=UPI002240F8F6|nr:autotransporter-associated beta strand repeat-containing protein [Haloferula sp. BvORR071]